MEAQHNYDPVVYLQRYQHGGVNVEISTFAALTVDIFVQSVFHRSPYLSQLLITPNFTSQQKAAILHFPHSQWTIIE